MTISEMHTGIKIGLDKTSSLEIPAFEQEEIDYWLNEALRRFIEEKINIYLKASAVGVVDTKLLDDIQPLLSYSIVAYSTYTTLPTDYWFLLNVYIELTKVLEDGTSVTDGIFVCDAINEADVDKYTITAVHRPYFDNPKYYVSSQGLNFKFDAFTTGQGNVSMFYVKEPTEIVYTITSTEYDSLPKHAHPNIVNLAVNLMIENIESRRFETNTVVLDNNK